MATETIVVVSSFSPEAAFDRLIDLSRVPEWDRGIRASSPVEGEPGVLGARYEVTVKGFDRELTTVVYELVSVDRPDSFTIVGSHSDFRAEDTVVIEPSTNGCRVTYVAGLVLLGEQPPMSEARLAEIFAAAVEIVRTGLESFLNPSG